MSVAETVRTDCKDCGKVVAIRIGGYYRKVTDDHPDIGNYDEGFIFAKCSHCEQPIVLRQDDAMFSQDGETPKPVQIFPRQGRDLDDELIPVEVFNALTEAIACFDAGRYRAANVMCRGTLECVCEHFLKQPGWKLLQSLKDLRKKDVIDDRLLEWAKSLHLEGNRAAHNYKEDVDKQDAADVLAFTRAIVDYTLVIKGKFDAYQTRVAKREKAKPAAKKPEGGGD